MGSECYALVRGSALRITSLDRCGRLADGAIDYGVSKSVARVAINEIIEPGDNEVMRTEASQGDERRLLLVRSDRTIRYAVDINFLRLDPGLLSLLTGVPVVYNAAGDVVGFDAASRIPVKSFALEVWTRIAGQRCVTPQWGYTVFPYLKGGILTGFSFANGLVSFNLQRATTQRGGNWGSGPYWLEADPWCHPEPVSGNTAWRQMLVTGAPPAPTDGVHSFFDEIDGGTASITSPDEVDGGTPLSAGPCEVDGGAA